MYGLFPETTSHKSLFSSHDESFPFVRLSLVFIWFNYEGDVECEESLYFYLNCFIGLTILFVTILTFMENSLSTFYTMVLWSHSRSWVFYKLNFLWLILRRDKVVSLICIIINSYWGTGCLPILLPYRFSLPFVKSKDVVKILFSFSPFYRWVNNCSPMTWYSRKIQGRLGH